MPSGPSARQRALSAARWVRSAAAGGHEAVVEVLLACGADAAKRDAQGRRAAAHARAGGHPCLAKRLDTVVDKDETMR